MKKFFTSLCCMAAMAAFALPANAQNTITLGEPFDVSPSASTWDFTAPYDVIGYYISSNSSTNLLETGELEFWFGTMFQMDCFVAKQNSEGNYYYQNTSGWDKLGSGNSYQLKYSGTATIQLTLGEGTYEDNGAGGDSSIFDNPSTSGNIEIGKPFLLNPEHASWTLTITKATTGYYFLSNSSTSYKSSLKASQKMGTVNVPMGAFFVEPIKNNEGLCVYPSGPNWPTLSPTNITITYSGTDDLVLIFYDTPYQDTTPVEVELNEPFDLGGNTYKINGDFVYQEGEYEDLSLVYLLTDKNTNLLEEGQLKVLADGFDVTENWEAVYCEKDGVYGYNGSVTDGYTYTFQYTGSAGVQFTLKPGQYSENGEPSYMEDLAAVVAPAGPYAVNLTEMLLTWFGQEISVANPNYTIVLYKGQQQQMAGLLEWSLTSPNAAGSGNEEGVDPLDDAVYDALLIKFEGIAPDTYTIKLPAGLVQNADGELNQAQTIEISVLPAAEYTVNPEPNQEYESLEKVTITFQGTVSENEYYEGENGITVNGKNASVSVGGETVTLNINAVGAEAAGQWDIVIPEGFFVINDGEALNPEINLAYFVSGPEPVEETSIDPANGIFPENSDVTITITYPGTKIEFGTETTPLEVYDSNEYNEAYGYDDDVISIDGMNVVIKLGELAKGTYNMTFREGAVLIDGAPNAGIDYTIMVDNTLGVSIIDNATGEKVIYNLQGVRVANPQKGQIYIINGQKTVLR